MKTGEAKRAEKILRILKTSFSVPDLSHVTGDPFKVLVRTIISQSTAETNTRKAFQNLTRSLHVTPKGLAEADVKKIEAALRVAGLYRKKSRVLKRVSEIILERFNGSLDYIHFLSLGEARERLMNLPGVGPKTVDIVLLFCAKRPILPVDTHVSRVSKRLGLVPSKADYEGVRAGLQGLYPPEEYFKVHMLFIALGRKNCKAVKPLHVTCPVRSLCPSAKP
ncbi:MAG: endonuclease III [Candidatus Bathyarchaeota archaeon]|nr:endonuclease III [Candidatus Bathyarchaeota archaeon]